MVIPSVGTSVGAKVVGAVGTVIMRGTMYRWYDAVMIHEIHELLERLVLALLVVVALLLLVVEVLVVMAEVMIVDRRQKASKGQKYTGSTVAKSIDALITCWCE